MRQNLTYAQRMALAEWLRAQTPEQVWDVRLAKLAELATEALGCPVTQNHVEYARKALALPKPTPSPSESDLSVQLVASVAQLTEAVDLLHRQFNALALRVAALEPPLTYADAPTYGGHDAPT